MVVWQRQVSRKRESGSFLPPSLPPFLSSTVGTVHEGGERRRRRRRRESENRVTFVLLVAEWVGWLDTNFSLPWRGGGEGKGGTFLICVTKKEQQQFPLLLLYPPIQDRRSSSLPHPRLWQGDWRSRPRVCLSSDFLTKWKRRHMTRTLPEEQVRRSKKKNFCNPFFAKKRRRAHPICKEVPSLPVKMSQAPSLSLFLTSSFSLSLLLLLPNFMLSISVRTAKVAEIWQKKKGRRK